MVTIVSLPTSHSTLTQWFPSAGCATELNTPRARLSFTRRSAGATSRGRIVFSENALSMDAATSPAATVEMFPETTSNKGKF